MRGGGAPVLPMWPPPMTAGGFTYCSPGIVNYASTVNPTNGAATYTPLVVTNAAGATIKAISVATITTAGASGAVTRLGIHKDNGSGQPGVVFYDAGTVDTSTAVGKKTISIAGNLWLPPGLYHLVGIPQGAPATHATYKTFNSAEQVTPSDGAGVSVQYGLRASAITGALVDNPTISGASSAPYLVTVDTL